MLTRTHSGRLSSDTRFVTVNLFSIDLMYWFSPYGKNESLNELMLSYMIWCFIVKSGS